MIKLYYILFGFLLSIHFSCQHSILEGKKEGSLSLLMDTKSGTDIPVIMKSTSTVDVDPFHIVIKNAGGQPIKQNFDTFSELKKEGMPLLLPIGAYMAEASSGDLPEAAFDSPCYRGQKEFVIEENTVTEVKLHCTHQRIKVSLK